MFNMNLPLPSLPILRRAVLVLVFACFFIPSLTANAQTPATLSGRITNSKGEPVPNVGVALFKNRDRQNVFYYDTTNENGEYILTVLEFDTYQLGFFPESISYRDEFYNNQSDIESANNIVVTAGATLTGYDAVLPNSGRILGTVTNSDANPIADVEVTSYYHDGLDYVAQDSTETDSSGVFTIEVRYDNPHILYFAGSDDYFRQYFNKKNEIGEANLLTVTAETTITVAVTMRRTQTISGTVVDQYGVPVPNVNIELERDEGDAWYSEGTAITDVNGRYRFEQLPRFRELYDYKYRLWFHGGAIFQEYYDDQDTYGEADTIDLTNGPDVFIANAEVTRRGMITGTLTDIYGVPLENVNIFSYIQQDGEWQIWNGARTGDDGNYKLFAAQPNVNYRLRFDGLWDMQPEFYNDVATVDVGETIPVSPGSITPNINAMLRRYDEVEADFRAQPRTLSPIVDFYDLSKGAVTSHTWNFGDGATSIEISPTHTYTASGVYTVSLTVVGAENSHTKTKAVTVADTPITDLSMEQSHPGGGQSTTPKVGQTIYFSATAIGSNVQYLWDFGDDTLAAAATATGQYVQHSYDAPGEYTVTLTASNGADEAVTTMQLIVQEADGSEELVGALALHGPSSAHVNSTVNFSATVGAGDNVSYDWNFGDGDIATGQTTAHTYNEMGLYTVTVTASNSMNSETVTKQIVIQEASGGEEPVSALVMYGPSNARVNSAVTFSATVGGGDNVSYAWDFGGGESGTGQVIEHTYAEAGTYTVTLTASNSHGDEQVTNQIVVKHALLLPQLTRAE